MHDCMMRRRPKILPDRVGLQQGNAQGRGDRSGEAESASAAAYACSSVSPESVKQPDRAYMQTQPTEQRSTERCSRAATQLARCCMVRHYNAAGSITQSSMAVAVHLSE